MSFTILVPQGAEHRAVCQGLKQSADLPTVVPIPVGTQAVMQFLKHASIQDSSGILLMGLCGSLSPGFSIGTLVLYQSCADHSGQTRFCDPALTQRLKQQLQVSPIRAFTSDQVVCSAIKKRELGRTYEAEVVDMEGFAILASLNFPVAMVRVVSDDAEHDLPDLTRAIDVNGTLQPKKLAIAMLKRPIASTRLIRGSLLGLRVLRQAAARLDFSLLDQAQ